MSKKFWPLFDFFKFWGVVNGPWRGDRDFMPHKNMLTYIELTDRQKARFLKKIDTSGGPDACHIWAGEMWGQGYGRICINYKYYKATRIHWIIINGAIPEGMYLLHKCDNPPCVNLNHLFVGTPADNMADKMQKGRPLNLPVGEDNLSSKLAEDEVREIKWLLHWGNSQRSIAKEFGVCPRTIENICHNRIWKHVHGPRSITIPV